MNAFTRGPPQIAAPLAIEDVRAVVPPLIEYLHVETMPADADGWVGRAALTHLEAGPLVGLSARFAAVGFGGNRRAVSASLLLRYGQAAGFIIARWLACGGVVRIEDVALKFSSMILVDGPWVHAGAIETPGDVDERRAAVARELRRFTEDLLASQHAWSRFSRYALWSMVTSAWAAQFTAVGERLGRPAWATEEARLILGLDPQTASAAPDI